MANHSSVLACRTTDSMKKEKEKQILQGILYADIENGCVDLGGRVEAGD